MYKAFKYVLIQLYSFADYIWKNASEDTHLISQFALRLSTLKLLSTSAIDPFLLDNFICNRNELL